MNRRRRKQIAFHDFPTGFTGARIFPDNRWVQMSNLMPWDLIDEKDAENFAGSENGNVAVSSRVAFGALVIKQELNLSDEETVAMIRENPHCEYFLGFAEFTDAPPFDSSKMVAFRRRFPASVLAEINEAIILRQSKEGDSYLQSGDFTIKVHLYHTIVVGIDSDGFNAADSLFNQEQTDLAIVIEDVNLGTSHNSGSDKQTNYKLTLASIDSDNVREMAQTLFDGQGVDGNTALCETVSSTQFFIKLAKLDVPFPRDHYDEYVGYYKMNYDPRQCATSTGSYTDKIVTECLERLVKAKEIKILDQLQVIRILVKDDQCVDLCCLNLAVIESIGNRFVGLCSKNVIYAADGPAGMHADNVYPIGYYGSSRLVFGVGVQGKNLTEWQFGLVSFQSRRNVSGIYMQVLPAFISRQPNGSEREIPFGFFKEKSELLTKVFLKGYQWLFDVHNINSESSITDILIYIELSQGNRVYLNFRTTRVVRQLTLTC